MHKRTLIGAITVIGTLALVVGPWGATARGATVTLQKLEEKRELSLQTSPFAGWDNGIELTLHVDGPDVAGARKYGKLTTIKAVDEVGTDLTAKGKGPSGNNDGFQEIRQPQTFGRMSHDEPKPTGFDVDLKLPTPSARAAKTIKLVSGEMQVLVGGEKKIITVNPIKSNLGKTVDDPTLKELGVQFKLVDPTQRAKGVPGLSFGGRAGRSVSADISGNIDAIASVSIVDAAGKKLSNGAMWSDNGGTRSISYDLEKVLPDDAALQLEVWPGQKTVTVPFELKDVTLP
jgi:hypothetical protein